MIKFKDLLKVKTVQSSINIKLDKIKQLENNCDGLRSQRITEKVQGGKAPATYQEARTEQIEKLKKEVLELTSFQNEVWDIIDKLDNNFHKTLLIDEYILGNDTVEKRRRKKGQTFGHTRKELEEGLKEAETSFMIMCMSENLGEKENKKSH